MKRLEVILIQVFAAIGSYLILSMPFAFGLEVNIFTSGNQEFKASITDFDQLIDKTFSYPYEMNIQYLKITLSSKDPGKSIEKVYLYRCKDYNPTQCIQNGIKPVISVSPFSATLWFSDETRWSDVQRNDIANFLILVKMEIGGKEVWTGSWDTIEETGIRQFSARNYDLDKLNLYLKPGIQGESAKTYVESYMSVPTEWVDHSVLTLVDGSSVSRLYQLTGNSEEMDPSETGTPTFYAGIITGNSFNGSSKEWAFILGGDGKVSNPVTFYGAGGVSPPPATAAKLKVDNWDPQTVTCESSQVLTVTSHVENVSALDCGEADCYFQEYYYTTDGVKSTPGSITCSITNPVESIYKYQCSVPVDGFPVCSAPKTSTFALHFKYKNDITLSGEFPVTLQTPPAKLIVNSLVPGVFDCGIDTELTVNLQVTNPPSGTPVKYYTFDGVNFETMSCSGSGNTFLCKISESGICSLLQEDLEITFKFEYPESDLVSGPVSLDVTFPPPSLGIDTVTPEVFTSGEKTTAEILLHVYYPDSITYSETDFKYKYMDNPFQQATCSLDNSFTNINYNGCSIEIDIPYGKEGVEELTFRLDGYQGGDLKSLLSNAFITIKSPPPEPALTIVSTSSPLDCIKDSSLTVQARAENVQGIPTTEYSLDGGNTFNTLTCSSSGGVFTCYIPKVDLCSLLTSSPDLILKFAYGSDEIISNSQKIYVILPEPHMQVYSVFPDIIPIGKTTQANVNLYIQYPETIGTPKFVYSYLDKADQSMSCQKVSSTGIRDYYRCSQTSFTIPSGYSGSQISVTFAVEGTSLAYPYGIQVTSEEITGGPWMEIYSTIPGKIETEPGNTTEATLLITVHNAAESGLKHSATLQPTKWITSGTCQESGIDYDFSCDVKITAPNDALIGENRADVTVRVSDGKTYTLTNQTKVYVLPGRFRMDVQTTTPDRLYCPGHTQQNPQQLKLSAKLVNLQADSLVQERVTLNGHEIYHTDRYCTLQANTITCNIPTDKLLEKLTCGQGDLAPGEGIHYYTLSLSVLLNRGGEQLQASGSKDLGIEAIPLQAYLEIIDTDIEQGVLKEPINCLGSKTIRLGEGGNYIRIRYADLLHQTPDEKDLTWSFRLDAYDSGGKLTKGMGVSPTANATICKLKQHQQVGVHRYEDYECTLFADRQMFQRCAAGEGTIRLTALSKTGGKSAEGEFKVEISKGLEDFNLYMNVEKDASDEITCWIVSEDGRCNLERSQLNATISIKNRAKGDICDLTLLDSDIQLKGGEIDADVYSPYCRETAQGTNKFLCGFGIKPSIKIEEKVDVNDSEQTFSDINIGELEFTALVKYADNLAEDSLKTYMGSITIKPEKDPNFLDYLEQKSKMTEVVDKVKDIMKFVLGIAGFCVTCAAGTWVYKKATTSPYEENGYQPEAGGIKFADDKPTCPQNCVDNPDQCPDGTVPAARGAYTCPDNPGMSGELQCCIESQTLIETPTFLPRDTSQVMKQLDIEVQKTEECDSWWCGVGGLLVMLGLFTTMVWWLSGKVKGEGTSEYTKALATGMKSGLVCLILQITGKWLSGDDGSGTVGKSLSGAGNFLYNTCIFLARSFPALIALLSIVMRWITFEMCVEDIERSLDQGYYGSGSGASAYRSGLTGTQSALSRLQGCMNQFEQISQDAWRIGQTMYYSGSGLWGTAKLTRTGSKTNKDLSDGGTICEGERIQYEIKNWCKVIMEDGYDAQWIKVRRLARGEDSEKECGKVILLSEQHCQGYYGYGYGTSWSSGWGSYGYRPLTQSPGSRQGDFSPLDNCGGDSAKKEHVYVLSTTRDSYIEIKYDPTC